MLKSLAVYFLFFFSVFATGLFAQIPVANFSADVTSGCGNKLVNFTDLSSNNPTSWLWDFGDGSAPVTVKDPSKFYNVPGTYTVKLTATNASGSDVEIKTAYIKIFSPPIAAFTASPTTICAGATVNFTDQSLPGGGAITGRLWDFGDGANSNTNNTAPSHTYVSAGTYNLSLSVTDANGCLVKKLSPPYITVKANPIASFSGTPLQFCRVPKTVVFNSTSTGSGLTYQWNFGDGGTSTAANPNHSYAAFGSYSVSLSVTDPIGCTNSLVQSNYVNIADFQANFSAASTTGCDQVNAVFTDMSTTGANSWQWTFGDGNTSTEQNPTNLYVVEGSHTVRLIASNAIGCVDTLIKTNYIVVNPLPSVSFTANKTDTCGIPYTVKFTDNSITGSAAITQWQWNFGDGGTSTAANPNHSYAAFGSYSVSLVVTDAKGCSASLIKYPDASTYIHIIAPQAKIERTIENCIGIGPFLPWKDCVPVTATVISTCSSPGSGGSITSYAWTFDNGYTSTSSTPLPQTYNEVGVYTATLTIGTSSGCSSTTVATVAKGGFAPVTTFTSNVTVGCYPLEVIFTDLSTVTVTTGTVVSTYPVDEWKWIMGDGDTLTGQNPTHTYTDTGYFDVKLIAYFNGCPDTIDAPDYIHVLPPKTSFTVTPLLLLLCSVPDSIILDNGSQGAHTWSWDFGDNTTSDLEDPPPHTYSVAPVSGFYSVKLVTTNTLTTVHTPAGCMDSLTINVNVANTLPGFTTTPPVEVCPPATATFQDTSVSNVSMVEWHWNFGDGYSTFGGDFLIPAGTNDGLTTGPSFRNPTHTYITSGAFSVTLKVVDQFGCEKTVNKGVFSIRALPTPEFSADQTDGCRPLTVAFTNSSFTPAPGVIVQYTWDYGDGSPTENAIDTTHVYSLRGSYSVKLDVTDDFGCSNTLTKTNYINPSFPYTNFAVNFTSCTNEEMQFISTTANYDGSTTGLTHSWDFGDGGTGNGPIPVHTFVVDTTKNFTVTLKVTDINGCDSSFSRTITAIKVHTDFEASATIADCPPFVVQFNDSSSAGSADIVFWQWDFGDGASSTLKNPLHTYNLGGKYTVKLIASTAGGCRDTLEMVDLIVVGGPSGSFTFSPSTGCAPLTVNFVATATKTEFYQWVFGDGATATGNPVSHTYTQAGTFNPILLITDSLDGTGDTIRCTVQVPALSNVYIPGPVVDFTSDAQMLCSPDSVRFNNLTAPVAGTETWLWNFGDNTTSTDKNPTHFFSTPGTYDVTLVVTIDSCVYTITKSEFIFVFDEPQILISANGIFGCTPYSVTFSVDTTTVSHPVSSWIWDLGDGTSSSLRDPVHVYTTEGIYSVSLTVVFTNSCSVTYPLNQLITVYNSPVADFSFEAVIAGSYISSIRFYNQSQNAITYLWDFGDNTTSTDKDPEHPYNAEGIFDIKLIAYSSDGCPDTVIKNQKIYFEIRMPNIFTPDGDGVNDYFNLLIPGIFKDFNLTVYDRWGKVVHQNDNYQNEWNGKNKSGLPVDNGTYYYVLKYNEKYAWYGWVMIINNQ